MIRLALKTLVALRVERRREERARDREFWDSAARVWVARLYAKGGDLESFYQLMHAEDLS